MPKVPRILLIDDDTSLRRVLEYNLQEEGYEVDTAADGESGLALFDRREPDLVITDLKMPGISGFQVLAGIRERSPEALVIVITAFGDVETAVKAMKSGAYDYVTKPFNREEFRLVARKALELRGLSAENRRLKEELSDRAEFREIIGTSGSMQKVFSVVSKVADTDATVLISGESGTGKELVARAIHAQSSRRGAPFVAVNCAAIPRDLLESELFGHVKGAFTGAIRDKAGKFQLADGGTIFLDEVGELPLDLQPKLLRALQERSVEPVGGSHPQKLDVRVVAATNVDLEKALDEGMFREDLYYRLAVIPVHLPPLRERREDIPLLIRRFLARSGSPAPSVSAEALAILENYPWPGNVRELRNAIERAVIMAKGDKIRLEDLPAELRGQTAARIVADIVERTPLKLDG